MEEDEEIGFDTIFTFGKYKGMLIEDILEDNSSYVSWLVENDIVVFSPEVMRMLADRKII